MSTSCGVVRGKIDAHAASGQTLQAPRCLRNRRHPQRPERLPRADRRHPAVGIPAQRDPTIRRRTHTQRAQQRSQRFHRHAPPRRGAAPLGPRANLRGDLSAGAWRHQGGAGLLAAQGQTVGVPNRHRHLRRVQRLSDLSLLRRTLGMADCADRTGRDRDCANVVRVATGETGAANVGAHHAAPLQLPHAYYPRAFNRTSMSVMMSRGSPRSPRGVAKMRTTSSSPRRAQMMRLGPERCTRYTAQPRATSTSRVTTTTRSTGTTYSYSTGSAYTKSALVYPGAQPARLSVAASMIKSRFIRRTSW